MMKRSPIDNYVGLLHEGIAEKIIGMLFLHKMKPALKKAEKILDDPEFDAQLETIRYAVEDFERSLKAFCRRRPAHEKCKNKNN